MESNVFVQLGVSILLGLLVGLQRQRTDNAVAGIRTFPLITVLGTLCGLLAQAFGGWVIAAGLVALAALLFAANLMRLKAGDVDPGLTTEIAVLVLFGVGTCIVVGPMAVAVAVGGMVAVLLQLKQPLHRFVSAMGEKDIKAIMQFVLVTLVILPVLPNKTYGPYSVLNPFKIWLFVILVVGMSLGGYVMFKFVGAKAGTWLGGVLGGIVSSTATTVSYARRSKEVPGATRAAGLIIMIASSVLYARLLVLIGIAAPGGLPHVALPLGTMLAACVVITGAAVLWTRNASMKISQPNNPAELKTALILGALYAMIRFGSAAAQDHFGARGLYAVAILGGLTDVDAVTLAAMQSGGGTAETGAPWRAILLASMSNLAFKAGIVAVLGGRELLRMILALFGATLLAGVAILWLWPQ